MGGVVDKVLVKDGERVKSNQILVKLDTEATTQRLKSVEINLRLKRRQLELKKIEFNQYTKLNEDSVKTLTEKVVYEKEILARYLSLADIGASAEIQYLKQRNTVKEVEGRLRETRLDGLRRQAILQQEIQALKSEISTLRSELAETKITLRYQVLRSPVEGLVFDSAQRPRIYWPK